MGEGANGFILTHTTRWLFLCLYLSIQSNCLQVLEPPSKNLARESVQPSLITEQGKAGAGDRFVRFD